MCMWTWLECEIFNSRLFHQVANESVDKLLMWLWHPCRRVQPPLQKGAATLPLCGCRSWFYSSLKPLRIFKKWSFGFTYYCTLRWVCERSFKSLLGRERCWSSCAGQFNRLVYDLPVIPQRRSNLTEYGAVDAAQLICLRRRQSRTQTSCLCVFGAFSVASLRIIIIILQQLVSAGFQQWCLNSHRKHSCRSRCWRNMKNRPQKTHWLWHSKQQFWLHQQWFC